MNITNKYGLPEPVYNVLAQHLYNPGDSEFSVTTLLKPPRMVQLERRYQDQLETDVVDLIWSVLGSGVHTLLEGGADNSALVEQRLYLDVDGVKVGGQVDHYHKEMLTDYKVTSAWTLVYGSRVEEWESQANLYATLLRANGYPVSKLQICAILRDFSEQKAKESSDYPKAPVQMIPLKLWAGSDAMSFLKDRVRLHKEAEQLPDNALPPCLAEEMWESPTTFAVKKEGRKRAIAIHETESGAYAHLKNLRRSAKKGEKFFVERRPGTRKRCSDYCPVADFCNQWKEFCSD